MSKSQVLDTSSHGYQMLFRDAVKATERALRRRWGGNAEVPLMSHALSSHDGNAWTVRDIGGQPVAVVDAAGRAELVDEVEGEA